MLSLLSPILRAMMCGNFTESRSKTIRLDDVEENYFMTLLKLACGVEGLLAKNIEELLELGKLADRLQMEAVKTQLENMLWQELRVENCAEMIQRSEESGLMRLQTDCYNFLRDRFQTFPQEGSFLKLSEETMDYLLEDDELWVDTEERVFEALVRWMRKGHDETGLRGERLLRKIRYGLIDDEYLAAKMLSALPRHSALKELVEEAMVKKGRAGNETTVWHGENRLCHKWMVPRGMNARILAADLLRQPAYVAIDSKGRIIVSDRDPDHLLVFNRDGSLARRLGSRGSAVGQFSSPEGVAVDRRGYIVVADHLSHRIQVLKEDGSVKCCFGSMGADVGQLSYPRGLAIDKAGHIVVADSFNDRIQVFTVDGLLVRHFGSCGTAIGQLKEPMGVAVDDGGRIVVADTKNHRVQVFNTDGSVDLCFGSKGSTMGKLNLPHGVAVDRDGRIVVADTGNDRLQIFDSDGSVMSVIGTAGSSAGQLRCPWGVVIDGTGRLVVVEGGTSGNHRVQVLRAAVGPAILVPWTVHSVPSILSRKVVARGNSAYDDRRCRLAKAEVCLAGGGTVQVAGIAGALFVLVVAVMLTFTPLWMGIMTKG